MLQLFYSKIQMIKQAMREVELTNLVLVLSCKKNDKLCFVYNSQSVPEQLRPDWCAITLQAGMAISDEYDGPLVGFASLDFLLPDLPTHGQQFLAISHLMRQLSQESCFWETGHNLAITFTNHLSIQPKEERERLLPQASAKIVKLALPFLMQNRPLENLIAIVPTADLKSFIDPSIIEFQLIYQNDKQTLSDEVARKTSASWLIGFEELGTLFPTMRAVQGDRFIKLRPILHHMHAQAALTTTCQNLAKACWGSWLTAGDVGCRVAAYALAVESILLQEDITDLVAIFPNEDFSQFIETGDAIRVYRVPQIGNLAEQKRNQYSLGDLVKRSIPAGPYKTMPVAFHVLQPILGVVSKEDVVDLSVLLWRSRHRADLARTLWLLSTDLLHLPGSSWNAIKAKPADITTLALHAAQIFSLLDPWQWRQGRFQQFLTDCNRHLLTCLLNQETSADNIIDTHYFKMLQYWFGCYSAKDVLGALGNMVTLGRQYSNAAETQPQSTEKHISAQLVEIGNALLRGNLLSQLPYDEEEKRPFQISTYIRDALNQEVDVYMPSRPFLQWLGKYQQIHAQWTNIQRSLGYEKPAIDVLESLRIGLSKLRRVIYAPAHEEAILRWAIDEDIERIQRLMQAVETGPIIKIHVRNPWLNFGFTERVRIDLENLGGAIAYQLQISLLSSRQFEWVQDQALEQYDAFFPAQHEQLSFEIRPKETAVTLQIVYEYVDHLGKTHRNQEDIPIDVRTTRPGQMKHVGNLFQAGPPVSGWGRFYGRQKELEQIITRLIGGITQPILMRGPRRMGKTSILRQLEWLLRNNNQQLRTLRLPKQQEMQLNTCVPVFHTLQAITDPNDTAEFFQTIYEDICEELNLSYDVEAISTLFRRSPTRAFKKQMATVFAQQPYVRPLVIIDEWDELYRPAYSKLAQNLRSLMEGEHRINWLVSSTWTLSEEAGRYGSPFYNQAFTIELGEMDWQPAVELVTHPSERMGVSWRGEAVVAILEQTGRRPYLIQLACSKIIDYLRQIQNNIVDLETVIVITEQIIKEAHATAQYFGFLWRDEKDDSKDGVNWMGKLILWALNAHYPAPMTRTEIRETIEEAFYKRGLPMVDRLYFNHHFNDQIMQLQLIFDALVVHEDQYAFSVPLMQRWLGRVISQQTDSVQQAHLGLITNQQNWQGTV